MCVLIYNYEQQCLTISIKHPVSHSPHLSVRNTVNDGIQGTSGVVVSTFKRRHRSLHLSGKQFVRHICAIDKKQLIAAINITAVFFHPSLPFLRYYCITFTVPLVLPQNISHPAVITVVTMSLCFT